MGSKLKKKKVNKQVNKALSLLSKTIINIVLIRLQNAPFYFLVNRDKLRILKHGLELINIIG